MKWADPLPRVLAKIDQVLKLPDITEAQLSTRRLTKNLFFGELELVSGRSVITCRCDGWYGKRLDPDSSSCVKGPGYRDILRWSQRCLSLEIHLIIKQLLPPDLLSY